MYREENSFAGADIIEGRNPIIEALRSGREIDKILVARGDRNGSIVKIISDAKKKGIVIQEVDRAKLDSMSQTKNHQGVIAYVATAEYVTVDDILDSAKEKGEAPFIVIADEITDPHNLGSVLRTANAAGVHGIIIPKRRSAGLNSVVAKTSAGAVEFTPVAKVSNIAATIDKLKKENVWIVGADMDGDRTIYTHDFSGGVAIVVGSEGNGISRIVKEKCDFLVRIPLLGEITSLNASVAGALMMYEVVRNRLNT
ncbi:MAG: 23S rRNA (guanosine(2251)-2'-O)-methyltransferase RlmB [Ruminococcaceae bacterium]|nr:23S rRNA (guanosine(2251)-2'-O)-methyltransferase RlmB [Oscillospiraceae bacterium]